MSVNTEAPVKERLSIARALVELKTIDKKINKTATILEPLAIEVGGKIRNNPNKTKEEFIADVKSKYQSIEALIKRRRSLKSAIVKSNAATIVEINGQPMVVAEAIERKTSIQIEGNFLLHLRKKYGESINELESINVNVQARLDSLLTATFSKEASKVKNDEHKAVAAPFLANNQASLIDPLKISDLSQKLEKEIIDFEQEVDIVLSESNAKTIIEI